MDSTLTPAPTQTLDLNVLVSSRQRLIETRKAVEEQIARTTDAIKDELAVRGVEQLEVGEYTVTLQVRDRHRVDKGELVNLGVSTDVIRRATKTSTYVQLDVRGRKS